MNQSGETKHDAELQKAFAEFKDSLRHAVDPANDPAPKLDVQIVDAPPATVRPAAPRIMPATGPEKGAARGSETKIPVAAEAGGRRKLLYLSAAVVISGLVALGWTLTRGHGTNDPEIEATAPTAEENAETAAAPLDAETGADPARPTETATPATNAASTQTESAATSQSGSPADMAAVPQPATAPAIENEAARTEPLAQPEAQKTAAPAVTAPAAAATNAAPARQAVLAPATASPEAEAAKPAAAKPKAARPKAAAKPKPATQARRNPTDAAPVAPPPAPVVAETPPPPPAPAPSDGPFGFVKNTVNSVGSTLTNLGRSATGN
jgi:hypothetical protein